MGFCGPSNHSSKILQSTPNCDANVTLHTDGQTKFFICVNNLEILKVEPDLKLVTMEIVTTMEIVSYLLKLDLTLN